jgi:hypothetical protein
VPRPRLGRPRCLAYGRGGQQAPNVALLLGVALAGTVVAEATPTGHVEKVALTDTLPLPDAGTRTWKGTVRVSPGLPLALAISVPSTSSRPPVLTTPTVTLKRQSYVPFRKGQAPPVTSILATPNGGGGAEVGLTVAGA